MKQRKILQLEVMFLDVQLAHHVWMLHFQVIETFDLIHNACILSRWTVHDIIEFKSQLKAMDEIIIGLK